MVALRSGRSNKNDANDARAVAVAPLRARSLALVRVEDHVSVLRLLAKVQFDIAHARSRACSPLHALVSELVAGGIGKEVAVNQGEQRRCAASDEREIGASGDGGVGWAI